MRLLLSALLASLCLPLGAQEFDLRGIPADSNLVMTFSSTKDLELSKHPAILRLRDKIMTGSAMINKRQAAEKVLREELGVDTDKDFQTLAIGLAFGKKAAAHGAEQDLSVAVVVRGRFDSDKIKAFAERKKLTPVTAGGLNGWQASEFAAAITGEAPPRDKDSAVFVYDASTVVVTRIKDAESCFASLAGKKPSYALPATATDLVPSAGKVYGLAHLDVSSIPTEPSLEKSGFRNATLVLSEQGTQQVYKLTAGFTDAEKAKLSAGQLQGFLGMAPLFAMPNPKDSPEVTRIKQIAVKLVAGFEPVKTEGERVSVGLKMENADLAELIEALYEMSLKQPAKPAVAKPAAK